MTNKFHGRDLTTDEDIEAARRRTSPVPPSELLAEMIYRPTLDVLEFRMKDGQRYFFPREKFQELKDATRRDLSEHEILGGTMLHFPRIMAPIDVKATLQGIYGSRKWMAELGKRGGSVTSPAKKKAARANGAKGGRPRKKVA